MNNLHFSNNNDPTLTNYESNENNSSNNLNNNSFNNTQSLLIAEPLNVPESETIDSTIQQLNLQNIPRDKLFINESIYVKTQCYRLYLSKFDNIQCSVIVLNNISSNQQALILLLHKFSIMNNVKSKNLLKFIGVSEDKEKDSFILIFEYVYTNYELKSHTLPKYSPFTFETILHLLETINDCNSVNLPLYTIRKETLLFSIDDSFKFLIPFTELTQFSQSYSSVDTKHNSATLIDSFSYDRYKAPELLYSRYTNKSDIWQIGCLALEMFSEFQVWDGLSEEEMDNNLKKFFVPKIYSDIPRHLWGILCECLCPYVDTRIAPGKLLSRYAKHIGRLGLVDADKVKMYYDGDKGEGDNYEEEGDDGSFNVRKCDIHIGKDAYLFCTYCNEIMCDVCKDTIHLDHKEKDCFYEYLEYVNTARQKTHLFKEKFDKYIIDARVPEKEKYDQLMKTSENEIEKLYIDQKTKIENQFKYIISILNQIEKTEIERLAKYKGFISKKFSEVFDNFNELQKTIDEVKNLIDKREKTFGNFQSVSQKTKENIMKAIIKEDNLLVFKKKKIIGHVTAFHKTKDKIDLIKRYFEIFISHYKDNKINDMVKYLEKKSETLIIKYRNEIPDEVYMSLITEFNLLSLLSSRNYFNQTSKELYIPISNKNEIFSYNFEINKYLLTTVDFSNTPLKQFPLYSRSVLLNNVLYINGGYDDITKTTLPYLLSFDRLHNKLIRLGDMQYGHSAHSLMSLPPNDIVAISGSGIVKCEKYDSINDEWVSLPDINIPRQNATLFYFNKQYIYAFGGVYWDESQKDFKFVEKVEKLNKGYGSVKGDDEWVFVDYKCNFDCGKFNLRKSVMSALSMPNGKCLLVGGAIKFNEYSDECVEFDFDTGEFILRNELRLPKKTCFPNKSFMYLGDKAWALDNDGNVIEFDFIKNRFEMIKENKVVTAA